MATRPQKSKPGAQRKPATKKRPAARRGPVAKQKPAARARRAGAAQRVARRQPESLRLRTVTASITVDDLTRSLDFYTRVLGFTVSEQWLEEGVKVGAMLRAGRCELGVGRDDWKLGRERRKGQGIRLYLETAQDVDALAARVRAAGGRILDGPRLQSWGAHSFSLDDPDGFHLTIYRQVKPRRS